MAGIPKKPMSRGSGDMDAVHLPKMMAELALKMPAYIGGTDAKTGRSRPDVTNQVVKSAMFKRNPTLRKHFDDLYLKHTGRNFVERP